MIGKVHLTDFGRFRNAVFDFSPVTAFVGGNESGKTTVFDAIFDGICSPRGNTVHGKRLVSRYGPERKSGIRFTGDKISMDPDEFLNINAIGAGNAEVEFSVGSRWLERVKNSMFTGGINPQKLVGEFDVLSRDKGNLVHIQRYRKKKEEYERLEKGLEELEQRRNSILRRESALRDLRGELKGLVSRGSHIAERLSEKERLLDQQVKIQRRENLMRTLALVSGVRELESELAGLSAVKEDRSEELKKLSREAASLESKRAALSAEAMGAASRLQAAETRLSEKERTLASLAPQAAAADRLAGRIETEAPRAVVRTVTVWNRALLAMSPIPAIAGLVLASVVSDNLPKALLAAAALAAASIMVYLSRRTEERLEPPDASVFIDRLKDDWRIRTAGGELKSSTVEGLLGELLSVRSRIDAAERELARLREERDSVTSEAGRLSTEKTLAESESAAAREKLERTLKNLGVESVEKYTVRRSRYEHVRGDHRKKLSELEAEMSRFHATDATGLKTECETLVAGLDKEITDEKLSEAAMTLLRLEAASLRDERAAVTAREVSVRSTLDKSEGEIKGSLGDLPGRIYEAQTALRRCTGELLRMEIDRKAAATVRDIFDEMSRDTDEAFDAISADITWNFAGMLSGDRRVSVGSFKADRIQVSDAGGGRRALENLSTGTRDAFHLAARLALALRSHEKGKPGLIVLDEPFHSLDRARSLNVLRVLRSFHSEHGWQIILFSKEEEMAAEMQKLFPEVKIHRLEPAEKP